MDQIGWCRHAVMGCVALLAAAVTGGSSSVEADTGVLLDSPGMWTLKMLGSSEQELTPAQPRLVAPIRFRLPADAAQGPDLWYIVHLHAEVEFMDDTGEGIVYISAMTSNDRTAAQALVEVTEEEHQIVATWDTKDIIDGSRSGTVVGSQTEVKMRNYAQFAGIVGGENALDFQLEQIQQARVKRVRILGSSGIEVTRTAPTRITISIDDEMNPVRTGDQFSIRYTVQNTGDELATGVVAEAAHQEGVKIIGEPMQDLGEVGREPVTGAFTFEALAAGQHRIGIRLKSNANRPGALVEVHVDPARDQAAVAGRNALRIGGLIAIVVAVSLVLGRVAMAGRSQEKP